MWQPQLLLQDIIPKYYICDYEILSLNITFVIVPKTSKLITRQLLFIVFKIIMIKWLELIFRSCCTEVKTLDYRADYFSLFFRIIGFSIYVDNLCKKANRNLYTLGRVTPHMSL